MGARQTHVGINQAISTSDSLHTVQSAGHRSKLAKEPTIVNLFMYFTVKCYQKS